MPSTSAASVSLTISGSADASSARSRVVTGARFRTNRAPSRSASAGSAGSAAECSGVSSPCAGSRATERRRVGECIGPGGHHDDVLPRRVVHDERLAGGCFVGASYRGDVHPVTCEFVAGGVTVAVSADGGVEQDVPRPRGIARRGDGLVGPLATERRAIRGGDDGLPGGRELVHADEGVDVHRAADDEGGRRRPVVWSHVPQATGYAVD